MDPFDAASEPELIGVWRCGRVAEARELALVLVAKGIAYQISREGEQWVLQVETAAREEAERELAIYRNETKALERSGGGFWKEDFLGVGVGYWTLPLAALCFLVFGEMQSRFSPGWKEAGILDAGLVLRGGEWWRVVTALCLHGDLHHLVSNLVWSLVLCGCLIPRFGQGLTWFLFCVSGAGGNLVNALIYLQEGHRSLGASSASFGALGLLTGDAVVSAVLRFQSFSWWRWMIPLGAGAGLLGFLGGGGEQERQVDVLAHFWGFGVGLVLGGLLRWKLGRKLPGKGLQLVSGGAVPLILCGAWWAAKVMPGVLERG